MPELTLDDVARIANDAARAVHSDLDVTGVVLNGGGSDYVEVVVAIMDCDHTPCQLAVGAFRNVSADELRRQLVEKFTAHVAERQHAQTGSH